MTMLSTSIVGAWGSGYNKGSTLSMSSELLQPNQDARNTTSRVFIRDGISGNFDVVFEMARVIRKAVKYDQGLERYAKSLLIDKHLNSYSQPDAILNAVIDSMRPTYDSQGFLASGIAYIQDIAGRIESIKSPRETLSDGYGDCDDQAILVASLLGCLGFEDVRIVMASYGKESTFSHVYCAVYINGKRYAIDTTLPDAALDKEVKPTTSKEINVFGDIEGLDGLSGVYNNTKHHVKTFARAALEAAPNVAEFVPLGFVAGNAFATGADLINRSTGSGAEQLSYNSTASKINRQLDTIIKRLLHSQIAIDNARSRAATVAAQLSTVQDVKVSAYHARLIQNSIKAKLDFINHFETYAQKNNIPVVYLDSRAMMLAGVVVAGGGAYMVYKQFFSKRR